MKLSMASDEKQNHPNEVGSEILAQKIEDLTVQEKGISTEGVSSSSSDSAKSEASRSFSPSGGITMNSLPPMINTGHYYSSSNNTNNSYFPMRTASPVADSASPTFGFGAGAAGHTATTSSSPSTSQVSVGSVGPTLVSALLNQRHHYDLTPVMRNTTSATEVRPLGVKGRGGQYVESYGAGPEGTHGIVSPETVDEDADFLHGEHLSLPADLSKAEDGPILPNLRKSALTTLPMQRAKSLGAAALSLTDLSQATKSAIPPTSETVPTDAHPPVEFPARKFYSFTSREQYKGLKEEDEDDLSEEESLEERPDLTPYMPSRQEFAEIEERLPPEALESIFIARRRRSSTVRENNIVEVVREEEGDEESSHKNHRLLQNPIPMNDRQWSIPSLRMAQRVATDGSLASITDHLDDESLLYVHPGGNGDMTDEDEASLSSRASSLYMSIGGSGISSSVPTNILEARGEPIRPTERPPIWNDDVSSSFSQHRSTGSSSFEGIPSFGSMPPETNKVVVESPWSVLNGTPSSHSDENSAIAVDGDRAMRRKRKQRQREEAALSWLQSLQQQSQQPAVAEAASSKFLTGRTQNHAFLKTATTTTADDATAFAAISEEAVPRQS